MASIKMEIIETSNKERIYIDLNDILDILSMFTEKNRYIIIFKDGDVLYNVKIRKSILNKFEKIKNRRGQTNGRQ